MTRCSHCDNPDVNNLHGCVYFRDDPALAAMGFDPACLVDEYTAENHRSESRVWACVLLAVSMVAAVVLL